MKNLKKYLVKSIENPKKAMRYIYIYFKYLLRIKRGVLIFIGMDASGAFSLLHRGYKFCYGFEPNPRRFAVLKSKYNSFDNIRLLNVAVTTYNGEIDLNISNNDGASSSIGEFDPNWDKYKEGRVRMDKTINVKCINLYDFLIKNNINYIDDYISDIQGMDLEVLKTLKPMIKNKMIKTIICEVTKNEKQNIYHNLPDNSERGFQNLLKDNYKLVAKGSGILLVNKFDPIPKDTWEFDCKWSLRTN